MNCGDIVGTTMGVAAKVGVGFESKIMVPFGPWVKMGRLG